MAKGKISMTYIEPHTDIEGLSYFIVILRIKCKSGYELHDNSVRIYYSLTPSIVSGGGTPYVVINPNTIDANTLERVEEDDGTIRLKCAVPTVPELQTDEHLEPNTTYWLRAWMRLYKSNGNPYKRYRDPKNPTPVVTSPNPINQELISIASYTNPHEGAEGDTEWDQTWFDLTPHILMSTYDVNKVDIEEDWEDANYVVHRIVPKERIEGSFDIKFRDQYSYNRFLQCIRMNRDANDKEHNRCVYLKVQVNNDLDEEYNAGNVENMKCKMYYGFFFLKYDSNPWNAPILGHFDEYEPIRIEIVSND